MKSWLRIRLAGHVVVAVLGSLVLLMVAGSGLIPVPALTDGNPAVPLALILPLFPVAALLAGITRGPDHQETVAVRPVMHYDLVFCAIVGGAAGIVCLIGWMSGFQPLAGAFLRNLLGFFGLSAIGLRLFGRNGALPLASAVVLVVIFTGNGPGGYVHRWAWPLAGPDSGLAWALALATLGLGLALFPRWRAPLGVRVRRPKP